MLELYTVKIHSLLNFIKDEYGNPPIYVTKNGVSERGQVDLNDIHRSYYYQNYVNQGLKGMRLKYHVIILVIHTVVRPMHATALHTTYTQCEVPPKATTRW